MRQSHGNARLLLVTLRNILQQLLGLQGDHAFSRQVLIVNTLNFELLFYFFYFVTIIFPELSVTLRYCGSFLRCVKMQFTCDSYTKFYGPFYLTYIMTQFV